MGSVWVGEMENLPGKEAGRAGKWEAVQAEGIAYAKSLRLKQGGRYEAPVARKSGRR